MFSEEKDDFILKPFEPSNLKRPRSALNLKRPTCEFARVAMALGDTNPRYRFFFYFPFIYSLKKT